MSGQQHIIHDSSSGFVPDGLERLEDHLWAAICARYQQRMATATLRRRRSMEKVLRRKLRRALATLKLSAEILW